MSDSTERGRGYRVLDADEARALHDPAREFAYEVLSGLSERPKRLPSRYFYDDRGSDLFSRIMDLDDYYLTQCELEVLRDHRSDILDAVGDHAFNLVDLGAGDARKTVVLLEELAARKAPGRYVPIDISEEAMQRAVRNAREQVAGTEVQGLVSEYTDGLHWLGNHDAERRNLVLFLGSNIGNFNRPRARAFLRRLWSSLKDGDLVLVGFDLKKDIELLLNAYNDREGVTAAFNLNLLSRINQELGANFVLPAFRHYANYNVFSGAMESYLVSMARQTVQIRAIHQEVEFAPWEPVHTEYSYKYLPEDIERLANDTGFVREATFHDSRGWFCDELWRVDKSFE